MKIRNKGGEEVTLHCQVPFCGGPAEHPVRVPLLCSAHDAINGWRYVYSPTLQWAILWALARETQNVLRRAQEQGVPISNVLFAQFTLKQLVDTLERDIPHFLEGLASSGIELPMVERAWLMDKFFGTTVRRAREFQLKVYCRMMAEQVPARAPLHLDETGRRTNIRAQVRMDKTVLIIRALTPVTFGAHTERLVVLVPWEEFFKSSKLLEGTDE